MLLQVKQQDTHPDVLDLREEIERLGHRTRVLATPDAGAIVRCIGPESVIYEIADKHPGVRVLEPSPSPHPLASRHSDQPTSQVIVPCARPLRIGGTELIVIAGPCSVETRTQIVEAAVGVRAAGAAALRGGVYKPRTSPYAFQGLGNEGLEYLAAARSATGLPIVTEVMDPRLVDRVAETADVLQIGARNMQNYPLLDEVARVQRPILIKRGPSATVEELVLAAERVMLGGNDSVILCERGIRTYETSTRNTLDVSAIPVLRERTHLPILVDPSHAAGRREFVEALALAGIAAGADGLLIEVHPQPETALTDAGQSQDLRAFADLMHRVTLVGQALGRPIQRPSSGLGDAA